MHQRILTCGDNPEDTESLEKIVEATEGEDFDCIIHTQEITNTWKSGLEPELVQLRTSDRFLEELAARGPLVNVYGNRDKERPAGVVPGMSSTNTNLTSAINSPWVEELCLFQLRVVLLQITPS